MPLITRAVPLMLPGPTLRSYYAAVTARTVTSRWHAAEGY